MFQKFLTSFTGNTKETPVATPQETIIQEALLDAKNLESLTGLELEFYKRNKEVLQAMPALSKYETVGYKYTYPIDYNTFFRIFMCKSPVKHDGKEYVSAWTIFEEVQGVYQVDIDDWSKELPNDITDKKSLLEYKGCLERWCIGKKKMNISLPFVPKEILFEQHNQLFFVNEKQVVVILELSSKVQYPLSDTFKFRNCYILTDETGADGKPATSISFNYYVDWYKSTILKPVLLRAAADEIKGTGASIDKILKKLMETGVFKKKKEELDALKQAEVSTEGSEECEGNGSNNAEVEAQQPGQGQVLAETKESEC